MQIASLALLVTSGLARPDEGVPATEPGAERLVYGMIAITLVAGGLEVLQQLRRSELMPVPLVIYATMAPILTFILALLALKGETAFVGWIVAVLILAPIILYLRLRKPAAADPTA